MLLTTALTLFLGSAPCVLSASSAATVAPADSIRELYQSGQPFGEFLSAAKSRVETWKGNYARRELDPGLLARARAVPGTWRLLVIAEDWCGDSANTIPYVATLVDSLAGKVEMRVVHSTPAHWLMERHVTWDGRAATPTIVLLDGQWREAGCWVERPGVLGKWIREQQARLSHDDFLARKYAWYDADGGRETVREMVAMLENATADGATVCGGNTK